MLQPKHTGSLHGYKNKTHTYVSTRDPLQTTGHKQTESEGWKKIFHANGNQKRAGVAILISEKIDFKIKTITRDKEGHYIMIKGAIFINFIDIYNL